MGFSDVTDSKEAPTLGAWLQQRAADLTQAWRRSGFVDGCRRPTVQLDGVVESFLLELGRGLDRNDERAGEAWRRTLGLLRHCPQRGAGALACEFRRLAFIVDAEARRAGASELERMRLRQHFVAAHALAAAEAEAGAGREGHLVIEVFELAPRIPMRRRFAA